MELVVSMTVITLVVVGIGFYFIKKQKKEEGKETADTAK